MTYVNKLLFFIDHCALIIAVILCVWAWGKGRKDVETMGACIITVGLLWAISVIYRIHI